MPGCRLVNGRIVATEDRKISWFRAVILSVVLLLLVATNPANERTTANVLDKLQLKSVASKWLNVRFSTTGNSYWERRTTNYFVATIKEQITGLEVGAAGRSVKVCSFDDQDWGVACRKLKTLVSHPGVEWWRLPWEQPPVVLHRLLIALLGMSCCVTLCHVPLHNDPLVSIFFPLSEENPFLWLCQVIVDSNVLLFPVWERLQQVTTLQAANSPFRIFGSNDALNFYAAAVSLSITAAGARLLTGHEQKRGWLIFLVTVMGYWRGTQHQQQEATILDDPTRVESDLIMWMGLRLFWFILSNGLSHVGGDLVTICLAIFLGAALGDYHYSQQIWQVWTQSWSNMLDNLLSGIFGSKPNYRAY